MALPGQIDAAARRETAPADSSLGGGDALLAMPARPAALEAFEHRQAALTVTGHARDADDARQLLQALGLISRATAPAPAPEPRHRARGHCPECRTLQALRVDGTIGQHRVGGGWLCDGEGEPPLQGAR